MRYLKKKMTKIKEKAQFFFSKEKTQGYFFFEEKPIHIDNNTVNAFELQLTKETNWEGRKSKNPRLCIFIFQGCRILSLKKSSKIFLTCRQIFIYFQLS